MMELKCSKCKGEIIYTDLEKNLRKKIGAKDPKKCRACRRDEILGKALKYEFNKTSEGVVTTSNKLGKRPIISDEEYDVFLDEMVAKQPEK